MRIGVFGGSFDPVHEEHIRLVEGAVSSLGLDRLFVMPAHTPPHKKGKTLSSNEDRLAMCKLAFADMDKVTVSDYEMRKGGTSYTYLTCRYFKELYPAAELFWLVGTDMLRDFPTWKNPNQILEDATLAVCDRAEKTDWVAAEQEKFYNKFGKKFEVIGYNGANVSSTQIRILAGAGSSLTGVTPSVAAYIKERGLYQIPFAKEALELENEKRRAHSIRVANLAVAKAAQMKIPEKQAITAALFHDCAKNLTEDSPYLKDFHLKEEWGNVPKQVVHQFAGAYVAEKFFGVTDEDVLNAVRFHTSGRAGMSELEKLIFLADMLEDARSYAGVDELRALFWQEKVLDACLEEALFQTLEFLKEKKEDIYVLTQQAYLYMRGKRQNREANNETDNQ